MRAFPVAVLVLLATGCSLGGNGQSVVDTGRLNTLVLQPGDLSSVFVRFDEGRQVRADQPAGVRSDPQRFGRKEGWKARYRRSGSAETAGPLVVESRADVFGSDEGAGDELEARASELDTGPLQWRSLESPDLGDEAIARTLSQPGLGRGVRFYLVAWREDNVTASVLVNGFEGKMTLMDALELARKQQARIGKAAGS